MFFLLTTYLFHLFPRCYNFLLSLSFNFLFFFFINMPKFRPMFSKLTAAETYKSYYVFNIFHIIYTARAGFRYAVAYERNVIWKPQINKQDNTCFAY